MQVLGIIAEYNPFHNGHLYHLNESKKNTGCSKTVVIMSGNFVQRGEPAIFDKWIRAVMAVKGGVDLVIELPFAFSVRSAQNFAEGGIRLLNALGIVHTISFGSESAEYALLDKIAELSVHPMTIESLKDTMKEGSSYAAALSAALGTLTKIPAEILNQPNNILAIEYLKALKKYKNNLHPFLLKRESAAYHDLSINDSSIASASAIRRQLSHSTDLENIRHTLPDSTIKMIHHELSLNGELPHIANLDSAVLSSLRQIRPSALSKIATISEGLENRIISAALKSKSIEDLLTNIKSKRYPLSRLQRTLLHILLHSPKNLFQQFDEAGPLYIRVLAFNDNGRQLLSEMKQTSHLPIITKITDYLNTAERTHEQTELSLLQKMLSFDTYATDLYALCFHNKKSGAADFLRSPAYVRQ